MRRAMAEVGLNEDGEEEGERLSLMEECRWWKWLEEGLGSMMIGSCRPTVSMIWRSSGEGAEIE